MRSLAHVRSWPVRTAAAAVVAADGTVLGRHESDPGARFGWASVTKLLTALGVLLAVEEGTVALDDPAGPAGSTVRHLLAHASGLAFEGNTVVVRPGRRRVYSNAGFETVAAVVARRAGMAFEDYVREGVLEPLGMRGATFDGSPASGATGTLDDLVSLARELQAPTVLAPATLAEATTVAFPGLSGVLPGFGRQETNDWGLGFELRDSKHPHWTGTTSSPATFGHFGQAGTFLWVDPLAGAACACLTDRAFGRWAVEAWPALTDAVLSELA